jgi:formamidopyrimidine-DNA glycosylase
LSFADRILGAVITGVRLGKPLRWPLGTSAGALERATVGTPQRRGKYLWLPLRRAAVDAGGLLMHLGMSGSLAFETALAQPGAHDHFDLITTAGTLRLTDPRRFGAVVWSPSLESGLAGKLLSGLGIEPFDASFDGEMLWHALRRRHGPIKQALLAGDIVVGAGNIYACEALFKAGIDPRARCMRLSRRRCGRLADAVRTTLAHAVQLGGSTLRNYRDARGNAGEFQFAAHVYGRVGQPCLVCSTPIRRIVQGQRSSFYCPKCQHV